MSKSIAKRLELLAKKLDINHTQLAEKAGLTRSTFSNYVRGISQPKYETLAKWYKSVNLNINWIVTGEGEPFRDKHSETNEDAAETASIHKDLIALQREKISALEKEIKKLKTQIEQKLDTTTDQAGHSPLRQDPEKNTERKRTS